MAIDPNKDIEAILQKEFRSGGFNGSGYSGPCEYDSGTLTGQLPQGTAMKTPGVGQPNADREFNYTSNYSGQRKLPTKP